MLAVPVPSKAGSFDSLGQMPVRYAGSDVFRVYTRWLMVERTTAVHYVEKPRGGRSVDSHEAKSADIVYT